MVNLQLPLLISKETLMGWKAVLDFGNNLMHMQSNVSVPQIPTKNGHISFHFVPNAQFYPIECQTLVIALGLSLGRWGD